MDDFAKASTTALAFLRKKLGFQLCMVTLTEGNDWTVIHSDDTGYGIAPGDVFQWEDSFCCEMVKGNGPRVAPNSDLVQAYANAKINQNTNIGAYVGVPLLLEDGRLFGTLCGIDPEPHPANLMENQELIELLGNMLSTILQIELRADKEEQRAERYQAQVMMDELTGIYNRAGWNHLVAKEEARYRRYRHSSVVIVVDLDGLKITNDQSGHAAGDKMIKNAASALAKGSRPEDVIARLGGDEFGIIGINCDREAGLVLCERVKAALEQEGIKASLGLAYTSNSVRIADALHIADHAMYQQKRQKASAVDSPLTTPLIDNLPTSVHQQNSDDV